MARCIRFEDIAINAMCEVFARFNETEVLFSTIDAYYNSVVKKMRNECQTQIVAIGFSREGRHSFFAEYEEYFSPLKNEIGYRGIKLRTGVLESDLQSLKKRITAELLEYFSSDDALSALEG